MGCRSLLLWLWLAECLCEGVAHAHGAPAALTWPEDAVGGSAVHVGNFCDVRFADNFQSVMQALSGRKLSVVINLGALGNGFFEWATYDKATQSLDGYLVKVMDEIAKRGGFTWRDSFTVVNRGGMDLGTFHAWATSHYDILLDWVTPIPSESVNITVLNKFLDTSCHLLVHPAIESPPWWSDVFSFLSPLEWTVWLTLFAFAIITARLYLTFEKDGSDFEDDEAHRRPFLQSVYLCSGIFTGAAGFSPVTKQGKLVNLSCGFLVLLVVSAYTANLASLLVVTKSVAMPVQSLEEAATVGATVCTANSKAFVEELDPKDTVQWKFVDDLADMYAGVRAGDCAAGVVRSITWKRARRSQSLNPGCQLYKLPDVIHEFRSGIAMRRESPDGVECTRLAIDVINVIILTMQEDGWFKELDREHAKTASNPQVCPAGLPKSGSGSGSGALGLRSLSGIFIIYSGALLAAVLVHHHNKFCDNVLDPFETPLNAAHEGGSDFES